MKNWADYWDADGLLRNSDTGDSARETATYICANKENQRELFSNLISKILTPEGFIRHPNPTDQWHKDPKEFSRDQQVAVMCAFLIYKNEVFLQDELSHAFQIQLSHPFKCQNKDLFIWEWVIYLRIVFQFWMYPLVMFLDLGLVINAIIRVIKSYFLKDDTADDINLATMCVVFSNHIWTPTVWIARQIYKLRKGGVYSAWVSYYKRPEAPPMDDLWKHLLLEYLN